MVHREVVGLMNGELVMGGILEGDCNDRIRPKSVVESSRLLIDGPKRLLTACAPSVRLCAVRPTDVTLEPAAER